MTDRAFRLLEFDQGFINERRVIVPRESNIFQVFKFIGELRRIKANLQSTINASIESIQFLSRRMIKNSMRTESGVIMIF